MVLGLYKDGKLVEVGKVASGLTDAMRKDMSENPDNYIGHVVEVEAMSTTKDGALRHPVFVRMRDDKIPEDCRYEEVF
jgi:ATP-dependent DNA ligase